MRQFWPFALVIFGIVESLQLAPRRAPSGGLVMIVGGIWFYASAAGWMHVPFWAVFGPTLLVLLGGAVVWRAVAHPTPRSARSGPEQSGFINTFAVMSGSEHKPAQPFQGANLGTVMGGVKLDLTGVEMQGDTAVVDVFAVMGGVEIYAPRDWEVVQQGDDLHGSAPRISAGPRSVRRTRSSSCRASC